MVFYQRISFTPGRTDQAYEKQENDDGVRVLTTRFCPRGIKKNKFDCWIRELSPRI